MESKAETIPSELRAALPSGEASADMGTSHVRADFDGLLELAEKLQQSLQELNYRYDRSVFVQQGLRLLLLVEASVGYFIAISCFFTHGLFFSRSLFSISLAVTLVIVDALFGLLTFWYFHSAWSQSKRLKQAIQADERDISEVVELLREIEPVFAKAEKLSVLERVQIRIRLSRFGIGSSPRNEVEKASAAMKEDFRARKSRVDQELMRPL